MSRMRKISLMNDFVFSLSVEMQSKIDNYVGGNYAMDDDKILRFFGLEDQFREYVEMHAA